MVIISFVFIGSSILTGCAKHEVLSQDQSQRVPDLLPGSCPYPCTDTRCKAYLNGYCGTGSGSDTIAVITNSKNPEETVGKMHNNGMISIMPNYNSGSLQATQQNVFSFTKTFMIQNHYDSATLVYAYNYSIQHNYYSFSSMPSIDSVAVREHNDNNLSTTAENYAFRLANLISSLLDSATSAVYTSFANQVIVYENQIINDNSLTTNEKNILLSAHSVARYSANYWMNYYNSQSSGLSSANVQVNSLRQTPMKATTGGWFNWKDTLGDDVAGALGGAAGGAIGGSLAGGVGALPGAAGGALIGGVGASVQNAAKQVWNHLFG